MAGLWLGWAGQWLGYGWAMAGLGWAIAGLWLGYGWVMAGLWLGWAGQWLGYGWAYLLSTVVFLHLQSRHFLMAVSSPSTVLFSFLQLYLLHRWSCLLFLLLSLLTSSSSFSYGRIFPSLLFLLNPLTERCGIRFV